MYTKCTFLCKNAHFLPIYLKSYRAFLTFLSKMLCISSGKCAKSTHFCTNCAQSTTQKVLCAHKFICARKKCTFKKVRKKWSTFFKKRPPHFLKKVKHFFKKCTFWPKSALWKAQSITKSFAYKTFCDALCFSQSTFGQKVSLLPKSGTFGQKVHTAAWSLPWPKLLHTLNYCIQ